MFEDIKKNKIKSWFIVLLFLAFIAVIVYYICMALDLGELSIIIAMIFAIISTWGSYYYSDKIVLKLNNARVYCTLNNIATITGYSGYDPEVSAEGGALTPGIDNSSYPRSKSWVVGVNLTF